MKLPDNISPAAARRRALLADLTVAVVIAIAVIAVAAGLGIVGVAAVVTLLALLVWRGGEALAISRRCRAG